MLINSSPTESFVQLMSLVDLQTFKTKRCQTKAHQLTLSLSRFDCPFYHSREDKRRSPFANTKDSLIYGPTYIQDYYSTQIASNLVEYLFHPDVYKTIPCKLRLSPNYQPGKQVQECTFKCCPYLHEREDVSALNNVRNLPVQGPVEQEFCQKISQADDLKCLLKGDKDLINSSFRDKIDKAKEHLKTVATQYEETLKKNEVKTTQIPSLFPVVPAAVGSNKPAQKVQNENWYVEYHYFYHGQKLPLIEGRHHEFKNYKDIVNNNIAPTVMKYIAAFLNSDGGVLYVGIDDNSVVTGFQISQHEFDKFLLNVDGESKMCMLPPLMPHKYSIRRIPVIRSKKGREIWVVEVKVTPSQKDKRNKVLTLYNRQAYMRLNASTHKLDAVSIIEFIKHHDEERLQQKTRMEMLEDIVKNLDRKDKPASLQECLELKEKIGRIGEKVEQMIGVLKKKEGEKGN